MISIVAFAGSTRRDSYNKKLVHIAAKGAIEAGAVVDIVDLADFPMPLFDEDLEAEQGMPAEARAFKEALLNADGFLIASPEYNSAYPAVLKNAIDWASRMEEGEKPLEAFKGKLAGIMATSPGALGGMRVLVPLRMLLENIGVMVLPNQKSVAKAADAFGDNGNMSNEKQEAGVKAIGAELVATLKKLKGE